MGEVPDQRVQRVPPPRRLRDEEQAPPLEALPARCGIGDAQLGEQLVAEALQRRHDADELDEVGLEPGHHLLGQEREDALVGGLAGTGA